MNELTKEERAYRRGALQSIEYLLEDISLLPACPITLRIGLWALALKRGRNDIDTRYLGEYLDEIRKDVHYGPR